MRQSLMIDGGGVFASLWGMTAKARNRLIAFSIMAAPFVFLICLVLFWKAEPLPPIPPLPNPNGYEYFLKASRMLSNDTGDYDDMNAGQVRKAVSADAPALERARAGLSNECRVPIQYSQSYISNHLEELAGLKRLARAFIAEGRVAEMENRPKDAAKSYLDTICLGYEASRGGVLIDELVGIAIEAIGTSHLQTLVSHLNANACGETATALEDIDSHGQTWSEVVQQETDWSRRTFRGWRNDLIRREERKLVAPAIAAAGQKFNAQEQRTSQLVIDLAARAYELDKGHPPANVAALVPDYLKHLPQDPLTGTNMVYSPR